MSIGERINSLRKDAGLSQGQLASLLRVSRQAVSKWENDLACPDTIKLIQLADILNSDVEYLATGNSNNHSSDPVPVKAVEIQEKIVEKIVEKPVITYVEKPFTKIIEKEIEKPVVQRLVRVRYVRNPIEFLVFGVIVFGVGLLVGKLL